MVPKEELTMRITHDSSLTAGSASKGSLQRGVTLSQLVLVRWGVGSVHGRGVPATAAANNICASQAIASATTALINGVLAVSGVATLDVPRSWQAVSSNAGDTTQTVTVRGFDEYGEALTETRTMNGTTIINGLKAFKTIVSATFSAALAGNLTMGTNTVLGLPFRARAGDIIQSMLDAAVEAGTRTVADTATPTAATGDIRGTWTPGTAPNGTRQYSVLQYIYDNGQDAVGGDLGQFKS
jgi:hypothetical protein